MYISGIQIMLHMTLNTLLNFPTRQVGPIVLPGAGLGLIGGGIALSTSAWVAAIIYLLYLHRTRLGHLSLFRPPTPHWSYRLLRIAFPAGIMSTLRVFSLLAFTVILKQVEHASDAIAAMSIGFAIESVMFMPSFGLAAAAAALVGQSLGMKRPDRAERLAWTAGHYSALVTICLAGPIFAAAPLIIGFLVEGKAGISYQSVFLLRSLCLSEFLFAYSMVLMGAMQGAGDTVRPLWITIGSLWGLRVPLAAILALPVGFKLGGLVPLPFALGFGTAGAWTAMSFTQGVQGVLSMFAFKAGHWKTEKV
jgi:Na+-driven multidrug efflux pump